MNAQQTENHEACHAVAAQAVYVAVRWVDPEGECRCEPMYPGATLPGGWAAQVCVDLAGPVSEWIAMGRPEDLRAFVDRHLDEEREFLEGECADIADHESIMDAYSGEFPDGASALWSASTCRTQWGVELDLLALAEDVHDILRGNWETVEKITRALLTEGLLDEERCWGLLDGVGRRPDFLDRFPLPQEATQ